MPLVLKKRFILCILLAVGSSAAGSNDSGVPVDTLAIYKKIKTVAYRSKVTRFLFHAIFVDPSPPEYEIKPLSGQQKKKDPNKKYEGRIIRHIEVLVYDPFGFSVNDTLKREVYALQRLGNRCHRTTRDRVIRNILLFSENDTVELNEISESERLIRAVPYVTDAHIYITDTVTGGSDSVDVRVFVQDKWSLDGFATGSLRGGSVKLREKNILGTGHRYEQRLGYYFDGRYEVSGRHNTANISGSFVSSDAYYTWRDDFLQVGLSLDRPFYSSLARWAGGIGGVRTRMPWQFTDPDGTVEKGDLDFYGYDVWLARSIQVGSERVSKVDNIIAALRYAGVRYLQRPSALLDTADAYVHTSLYLGSLGFSRITYYKDQYIYRFGANEDIPEGLLLQALFGFSVRERDGQQYYTGFEASWGKYITGAGYFSLYSAYGTYFNRGRAAEAVFHAGVNYFTDLLRTERWYYRQFAYLSYVCGINRPASENITIRSDELYGFNSGTLTGKTKLLLNLEGVTYAPYNLIGFRFAPLLLAGFGMLAADSRYLFNSRIYHAYALGVLIRNESMLNSSFKITLGIYPNLPGNDGKWFRMNPVAGFSIKFRSFSVSRPSLVRYE
ncbi:MAG: hypothetical protein AB1458_07950 [Bacteroidota bacterium]